MSEIPATAFVLVTPMQARMIYDEIKSSHVRQVAERIASATEDGILSNFHEAIRRLRALDRLMETLLGAGAASVDIDAVERDARQPLAGPRRRVVAELALLHEVVLAAVTDGAKGILWLADGLEPGNPFAEDMRNHLPWIAGAVDVLMQIDAQVRQAAQASVDESAEAVAA